MGLGDDHLSYTGDNPDINYIDTRSGLYTNSELPAVSPPAMLDIVRLPSRTVAISAENPFEILSTKPARLVGSMSGTLFVHHSVAYNPVHRTCVHGRKDAGVLRGQRVHPTQREHHEFE